MTQLLRAIGGIHHMHAISIHANHHHIMLVRIVSNERAIYGRDRLYAWMGRSICLEENPLLARGLD
ncbi:hypothetical protein ASG87_15660 [Frateuria sp. Soil773]|nr:hypothetical protein ASG87_15660 [Frateuria sp. Soil773]